MVNKRKIQIGLRLNPSEVRDLLEKMDFQFSPNLSRSIDFSTYSKKLSDFASFVIYNTCEALIAYYCNEAEQTAYIPLVWVDEPVRSQGIAMQMFETLHDSLKEKNIKSLGLEVIKDNRNALKLYLRLGYNIEEDRGNKYLMKKLI